MDLVAWIIILIVCLVCYLIYYSRKDRSKDKEDTLPEPTTHVSYHSEESVPTYVTIYEYTAQLPVKRCVCCDGENEIGETRCCICGGTLED